MTNPDDDFYIEDDLTYADAARSRADRYYAIADRPGTPRAKAENLAGKAHRLLQSIKPNTN